MIEVEVKARIPSDFPDRIIRDMVSGWEALPERVQEDIYFSHPCRDFSKTDEALRIRCQGDETLFTYKGPKLDGISKTREELEVPCPEGLKQILERLGFERVGEIRKRRRSFFKEGVTVCLDDVEGLGKFLEIESRSEDADSAEDLVGMLEEVGLKSERRSYLELLISGGC